MVQQVACVLAKSEADITPSAHMKAACGAHPSVSGRGRGTDRGSNRTTELQAPLETRNQVQEPRETIWWLRTLGSQHHLWVSMARGVHIMYIYVD